MDADLQSVTAALAGLTDTELRALNDATHGVPQIAPGLLAWIEHACNWELYRLRGFVDTELRPPVDSAAYNAIEGTRSNDRLPEHLRRGDSLRSARFSGGPELEPPQT